MFNNIYEIENAIKELIKNDNHCSAHFKHEYDSKSGWSLNLITYNPNHKTHFLLHSIPTGILRSLPGDVPLNIYVDMYNHIFNLKKTMEKRDSPYLNYTIEWRNNNTQKTERSYFYGNDVNEVMKKFYYKKTKSEENQNFQIFDF